MYADHHNLPLRCIDTLAAAANVQASKRTLQRLFDYKKQYALLPTVDHLDDGLGEPKFAICGWRTNDCKNDLTIEELAEFCRMFLRQLMNPPS
jgi:hypothetical protein